MIAGALILRVAALFAPVSLSDDVYRYAYDGAIVIEGGDPYEHRPRELGGDLSRLNSPDYYSVYPPLAQGAFALAALTPDPVFALRLLFVICDLLAIAILLPIARRPLLLYAWCPLVYWEIAAGAHTEALMLPFLALFARAMLDARFGRAAMWLGLAASAKLTALVLLPLLFVHAWRERAAWRTAPAIAIPILSFAPFASAHLAPHVGESLALYARTFSFNTPVYYGVRWLFGYERGWNEPMDHVILPLLAALTVLWLAVAARRDVLSGIALSFAGYLLLSRVIHPWYLLPALPFAALAGRRAILLFAVLTPLSYLRYDPLGHESPFVLAAQVIPPLLLVVHENRVRFAQLFRGLQGLLRGARGRA